LAWLILSMTIPFDHDSESCLATVNEFLTACAGVASRCPLRKRVAAGMCALRGVAAELANLDFVDQSGAEFSVSIASIVEAHH
jgi:hypothetical protein